MLTVQLSLVMGKMLYEGRLHKWLKFFSFSLFLFSPTSSLSPPSSVWVTFGRVYCSWTDRSQLFGV